MRWIISLQRRAWLVITALLLVMVQLVPAHIASAAQLANRSLVLSTATPSASADETINFAYQTTASVGSILIKYCSNSPKLEDPCSAATGLSLASVSLSNQTGNTGFSIYNVDVPGQSIILSRSAIPPTSTPSSYTLSNIINPSAGNYTVYVRLTVYPSSDASGQYADYGAVAFSTTPQLAVGAFVPPFLIFCAGLTVAPDCSSSTTSIVDLGTLKATATGTGQSQMAAATNDNNGYFIAMQGTTLTSGNNIIPAMASSSPSQPGSGQFGINLRANSNPSVGADPSGDGSAQPTANYNQPNLFIFNDGDTIVSAPLSTAFNRMTVSYIANIDSSQAPGVYTTTITFIATAQF